MPLSRRFFLFSGIAALAAATTSKFKAVADMLAPAEAPAVAATAARAAVTGAYGEGVRKQVFEVIVRQGIAGAPWREICAGPMQVNNITEDEVASEIVRRKAIQAEHGSHRDPWDVPLCEACRHERWKKITAKHAEHAKFTLECGNCAEGERARIKAAIDRLSKQT